MSLLSGFTFIRNAIKYDFPILECIESMLPIVDELIINVGKSEDSTDDLVSKLTNPKIKIIHSVWDDSMTENGLVLSQQTNIALAACKSPWALYLQADEALHENEHQLIREAVENESKSQNPVEGFRFKYLHFYGGYNLIQRSRKWYPSEVRIIRTGCGIQSYGDAQTFRGPNDRILNTKLLNAHIFHYGHARAPDIMRKKIHYFHRFWHGDSHQINTSSAYNINFKDLVTYWGSHPTPYMKRVSDGKEWSVQMKDAIKSDIYYNPNAGRQCFFTHIFIWISLCFLKRTKIAGIVGSSDPKPYLKYFYDIILWRTHEVSSEGFRIPENINEKATLGIDL